MMDLAKARELIGTFAKIVVDIQEGRETPTAIDWVSVAPAVNEAIESFLAQAPSSDPMRENVAGIRKVISDLARSVKR